MNYAQQRKFLKGLIAPGLGKIQRDMLPKQVIITKEDVKVIANGYTTEIKRGVRQYITMEHFVLLEEALKNEGGGRNNGNIY